MVLRIKKMVLALKSNFGEISEILQCRNTKNKIIIHKFPKISILAEDRIKNELNDLNFGYRSKYINEAAKQLLRLEIFGSQDFFKYRSKNYEETFEFLRSLNGVGPKVADCVGLMSLDQLDSVPIDTHMWKISRDKYKWIGLTVTSKTLTLKQYKEIGDKYREKFGKLAGWAHSILFTLELKAFKN